MLAACVPGSDDFVVVDDAGRGPFDASLQDGGPLDGGPRDGGPHDAGPGDAGADGGTVFTPTALDVECGSVWTDSDGTGPCAGREVVTVAVPFQCLDVAVARAADGTITAAFNDSEGFDVGRIGTTVFHEDAARSAAPGPTIEPESALGDVVGVDLALATEPPDIHHLAYWLRSDFGHEVRYRRLRGGVFTPVQTLETGVGRTGVVDVAIDSDRRAVVAWHDDTSGENAVRREVEGEAFSSTVNVRTDGDSRIEGAGAAALHPGRGGRMHFAYQWCISLAASAPSYSVASGTMWSTARTLDNQAIANRASGVAVDVTSVGDEVVAAYVDWIDGVGELRFARFTGSDEVSTEVYLADLRIADRPGDHPLVLQTDAEGLLSLLVADAGFTLTRLQWHRQTRVGGEVRWLVDTIAEITAPPEEVHVAMVLGPDRRPHIVYWDRTEIRYATARP